MIKESDICLTDNCFNDREYGATVTYWIDKWGNKRFNAPMLDYCTGCRIKRESEGE